MKVNEQLNTRGQNIRAIINKYDPVRLIVGGAPEDEYDQEVKMIIRLLDKILDTDSLAEGIYEIFRISFGEMIGDDKNIYREIAKEVIETINT